MDTFAIVDRYVSPGRFVAQVLREQPKEEMKLWRKIRDRLTFAEVGRNENERES